MARQLLYACQHLLALLFLSLSLSPRPCLAPKEWKSGILEFERAPHIFFDSLREITPQKSSEAARQICLPSDPAVIQGAPDLSGVAELREEKGLQRFNTLSFLAKA